MKNKARVVGTSLFAFKEFLTLVSYVPKKNKAVILVSTKHHDSKINNLTNKPEIIMDYNKYKGTKVFYKTYFYYSKISNVIGGVDTFDHLVALNSCRRKTNKWPFNVFMFMVDAAAQNAFAMFKLQNIAKIDFFRGLKPYLFLLLFELLMYLIIIKIKPVKHNWRI